MAVNLETRKFIKQAGLCRSTVEQLALVPFSFPTYANALGRAAVRVARELESATARTDEDIRLEAGAP